MRILVEPSDHSLRNLGDAAMLLVALQRLHEAWPDADIAVPASDAAGLRELAPRARTIDAHGRGVWGNALEGHFTRVPKALRIALQRIERGLRRRAPAHHAAWLQAVLKVRHGSDRGLGKYLEALRHADLVLVAGMGAINDTFADHAHGVLDLVEAAVRSGAAVAMMGQGIGPMDDPRLRARAAQVLPQVHLIGLREGTLGPALLAALGVPVERIRVTGDDAIECAIAHRSTQPGDNIGFNLRTAGYAGIDRKLVDETQVAREVLAFAAVKSASIERLPISLHEGEESDANAISAALGRQESAPESLAGHLDAVNRCRVVATASYHAAVFALAQGVPAACMWSTPYYRHKFEGLRELFGDGVSLVHLAAPHARRDLGEALEGLWSRAASLRPKLLARADAQAADARAAYGSLRQLVPRVHFHLDEQHSDAWLERARVAARLLKQVPGAETGKSRALLADIGCGDMKFLDVLRAEGIEVAYEGLDLHPQAHGVRQFDVEKDRLPHAYDFSVLLGVTEYLADIAGALGRVAASSKFVVASHCSAVPAGQGSPRWRTHLTREAFVHALGEAGLVPIAEAATPDGSNSVWLCRSGGPAP